ncbi:MAG: hypothetical protein AAF720_04005 [Pseudomonadota bacterium]
MIASSVMDDRSLTDQKVLTMFSIGRAPPNMQARTAAPDGMEDQHHCAHDLARRLDVIKEQLEPVAAKVDHRFCGSQQAPRRL